MSKQSIWGKKKKMFHFFFASLVTLSSVPQVVLAVSENEGADKTQTQSGPIFTDDNGAAVNDVNVYMTSTEKSQDQIWYKEEQKMENQLAKKEPIELTSQNDSKATTINIDTNKKYQTMLGIGPSLEESTVNNLAQLDPAIRRQFLKNLVDPINGAGMTLFRLTIGTSDFTGQNFYTYFDQKPADLNHPDWNNETGKGFSIEKDREYKIVETAKELMSVAEEVGVSDQLKFFSSSWSPPGWMKTPTNNSLSYKNNELGLKGGRMNSQYIDALAKYSIRYLEEYAKEGIPIYAMTLQNEPLLEINYPSALFTGEQEALVAKSIKRQLPESNILKEHEIAPKVWVFDHNFNLAEKHVAEIFAVEGAAEAVDGVAFHPYGGEPSAMQQALNKYRESNPDLTVNLTERSVWGTYGADQIIQFFRNGASSYNSWVTMLDSNIAPHQWVGTPDPTMFARKAGSSTEYWAMPEYYITGNFARFIRPGAVRVESDYGATNKVTNVVFYDETKNELTAVVTNQTSQAQTFKMVSNGTQFEATLPAQNVATYIWSPIADAHKIPGKISAPAFQAKTEGIVVNQEAQTITAKSSEDSVEYIVDVNKKGDYYLDFTQKSQQAEAIDIQIADQKQKILAQTVTGETGFDVTRAKIEFKKAGIQKIKISPNTAEIKELSFSSAKAAHILPGKILASEYEQTSGANINGTNVENLGKNGKISYRVIVPKTGKYQFSLAAASQAESPIGFRLVDLDLKTGEKIGDDLLVLGDGSVEFDGNADFNVSGDSQTYTTSSSVIELTKGEHLLQVEMVNPFNLAWLSIGSELKIEEKEIFEGSEDAQKLKISVDHGIITEEIDKIEVNGLPVGVDYKVSRQSATELTMTLVGNRTVAFDSDKVVTVSVPVKQNQGDLELVNDGNFKITPLNLKKVLSISEESGNAGQSIEAKDQEIILNLSGATFKESEEALKKITLSGSAANFFEITQIERLNIQQIKVSLKYSKKYYSTLALELNVPGSAYDDSTRDINLKTSITAKGDTSLPTAIPVTKTVPVKLTEDLAYQTLGSVNDKVAVGNKVDYFVDIKEAGEYTLSYNFSSLNEAATNGLKLNGGKTANGIGISANQATYTFPRTWGPHVMKDTVTLEAGVQTLQLEANAKSISIKEVTIEGKKAPKVIQANQVTTIEAKDYFGGSRNKTHLVENNTNIGFTENGTYIDYAIDVEKTGNYTIHYNYATDAGSVFELLANNEVIANSQMSKTNGWSAYRDSEKTNIHLESGVQTLRLKIKNDGANIRRLIFTAVDESANKTALKSTITRAEALKSEEYSEESFKALTDALAIAKSVNQKETATQVEVDEATTNLESAITALEGKEGINLELLKVAITNAESKVAAEYTPESYQVLAEALLSAQSVLGNPAATQAQIDEVTAQLNNGITGLIKRAKVNKTRLVAAVEQAESLKADEYTAESYKIVIELLEESKELLKSIEATQLEVNQLTAKLNDALANLRKSDDENPMAVNKEVLMATIKVAEELETGKYTAESYQKVVEDLGQAKVVVANLTATQVEVNEATNKLNNAIAELVLVTENPVVNKELLIAAIAEAEKVESELYTAESLAVLRDALSQAKGVLGDSDTTQTEVNEATNELNQAVISLVKLPIPEKVNKEKLTQIIQKAEALEAKEYTPESFEKLTEALTKGKEINQNPQATQDEVNRGVTDLTNAIEGLKLVKEPVKVDKGSLRRTIQKAEELDVKEFSPVNYAPFSQTLATAKEVESNEAATQEEVNGADQDLETAITVLVDSKKDSGKPKPTPADPKNPVTTPTPEKAKPVGQGTTSGTGTSNLPKTGENSSMLIGLIGLLMIGSVTILGRKYYVAKK